MIDLEDLREALDTLDAWTKPDDMVLPIVAAAARELLAGQKVWWCEVHRVADGDPNLFSFAVKEVVRCFVGAREDALDVGDFTCRMVEAVLVIPE